MGPSTKQAHFLLPKELIDELKKCFYKKQSKFLSEALRKELKRLRLEKALRESFGTWEEKEHPEFQKGTDTIIRNRRKSSRLSRQR